MNLMESNKTLIMNLKSSCSYISVMFFNKGNNCKLKWYFLFSVD